MAWKLGSASISAAFLILSGAAGAEDQPELPVATFPEMLQPYVSGDRPELGDYRWMRGDFPGATEEQVGVTKAAKQYGYDCYEKLHAHADAQLRALNIEPIEQKSYSIAYECDAFNGVTVPEGTSWQEFQNANAAVLPLMRGLVYASNFALPSEEEGHYLSLQAQLRSRILADQMVRNASVMAHRKSDLFAEFDELQLAIARDMLRKQMAKIDSANTVYLSDLLKTEGWPKASAVGIEAAQDAWLLIQHADADPALQVTVLRQMENMLESEDASARNYAYLYDRVMLKVSGKQRYATQFECRDGKYVPQPLERDIASSDRYRAAAGIETVAENAKRINNNYGACP